MLIIPHKTLTQDALYGVLDDFINREGTDYGGHGSDYGAEQQLTGLSLQQKRRRLLLQLEQNRIVITFDPATESTSLQLT